MYICVFELASSNNWAKREFTCSSDSRQSSGGSDGFSFGGVVGGGGNNWSKREYISDSCQPSGGSEQFSSNGRGGGVDGHGNYDGE